VGYHLLNAGAHIELYLSHARDETVDKNFARLKEAGVTVTLAKEDEGAGHLLSILQDVDILVDALLGTGIKLPLRGSPEEILNIVQPVLIEMESPPFVVAVDCPSGLDCDSGEIADQSLHADLTVTLAAAKSGLFEFPGADFIGDLQIGSIGVDPDQQEMASVQHMLASGKLVAGWLPDRPLNAHKGTFGRVIVVAGSINYPGAAALAAVGAYRSGAGLVTVAVPSVIQAFLVPALPEATWLALPHEMGVISKAAADVLHDELQDVDALLIGPGFGRDAATAEFQERFLAGHPERSKNIGFLASGASAEPIKLPPAIVDADGLKLLSEIDGWHQLFSDVAVLTPHPGEFAIMTGRSITEILERRIEMASDYAREWGHVIVLKGAYTVVASPEGRRATIPIATPALATAGTGDVLSGVILALRGQGLGAFESAVSGAYIHARAGEIAAHNLGTEVSVMAGDVVDFLPDVFAELGS
jgi:NAD(P)H-hydrate epimerase